MYRYLSLSLFLPRSLSLFIDLSFSLCIILYLSSLCLFRSGTPQPYPVGSRLRTETLSSSDRGKEGVRQQWLPHLGLSTGQRAIESDKSKQISDPYVSQISKVRANRSTHEWAFRPGMAINVRRRSGPRPSANLW